jgi:hypothetical protein
VYAGIRRVARNVVKPNAPLPAVSPYPGHYGLVRSVVEGLRQIGADFNFNPESFSELAEVVYAPANEALGQAADCKRQDIIKTLIAGPTNALLPHEAGGVMLLPEIDVFIVASEWVRELMAALAPSVARKLRVCQAGIDADFWTRTAHTRSRRPVVYWKDSPEALCVDVEDVIMAVGLEPLRIKYGQYDSEMFKTALNGAPFAVFLSTFETQGLALAEAWAMDVPTLVWDPQSETEWAGGRFRAASSAPFLTPVTGLTWKTIDELEQRVRDVMSAPEQFASRAWVRAHMTDALCAANLYDIIRQTAVGQ